MTPQGKTLWNRDVPNDARVVRDRVLLFSLPSVVALEACCGAANFAEELRRLTQWDVKLANPSAVNAMKRGADKTDPRASPLTLARRLGHLVLSPSRIPSWARPRQRSDRRLVFRNDSATTTSHSLDEQQTFTEASARASAQGRSQIRVRPHGRFGFVPLFEQLVDDSMA